MFSLLPYDLLRYRNRELLKRIRRALATSRFDVVEVEGAHAAWYGVKIKKEFGIPTVIRVTCVQYVNTLRLASSYRNPLLKLFLRLEAWKTRRCEAREGRQLDVNLVISDVDGSILKSLDDKITCVTVPVGMDLDEWVPATAPSEPKSVLWMGSLGWLPNQDSFWWFYRAIVPKIVALVPDVHIRIVGSNPPADILAVRHPNVSVLGFVPDVREAVRRARVCVVPLQAGSGIRIKLLEMFALQKAVVSTSIGCEGLNVEHEKHLLVADRPDDFAAAVVRLLADSDLCATLGRNGRAHVQEQYGWNSVASKHEDAHRKAIHLCEARREA
jgi:glycosyltransferase involved in cell wall biosynthesis